MELDGSDARRITDFESMSWAPYPHPSGEYFIFTTNKHGFENFELFIVDTGGFKQPVRVTFTDGFDGLPVFSPDGRRLAWTSGRGSGDGAQLWIARWDHAAASAALDQAPLTPRGKTMKSIVLVCLSVDCRPRALLLPSMPARRNCAPTSSFLAGEKLAGRMTGSEGEALAVEYIAAQLKQLGAVPLPGLDGYSQPFDFTAGMNDGGSSVEIVSAGETHAWSGDDVQALSFSDNETVSGEVVFAGYGLSIPEEKGFGYDSYFGLDVKDKIVVVLRYVPEDVDDETRAILAHYSGLRYKALHARELGARALVMITGPRSRNAGKTIPMTFDTALGGSGISAASVSGR